MRAEQRALNLSLTHSADCGRRSELEVVGLKDKVDVVSEVDPLAIGQREEVVVVQHGIKRLDPLGVHVPVANQPRLHLLFSWQSVSLFERELGPVSRNVSKVQRGHAYQMSRRLQAP